MNSTHGEFADKLGMTVINDTPEHVIIRMNVEGHRQPYGLLHGGANAALVEHAASLLALHHCPDGRVPVGVDVSTQHLKAVRTGHVEAHARILALSNAGATIQVEIYDESARHTATGTLTLVFIDEKREL